MWISSQFWAQFWYVLVLVQDIWPDKCCTQISSNPIRSRCFIDLSGPTAADLFALCTQSCCDSQRGFNLGSAFSTYQGVYCVYIYIIYTVILYDYIILYSFIYIYINTRIHIIYTVYIYTPLPLCHLLSATIKPWKKTEVSNLQGMIQLSRHHPGALESKDAPAGWQAEDWLCQCRCFLMVPLFLCEHFVTGILQHHLF
jgi:hypothetical protein